MQIIPKEFDNNSLKQQKDPLIQNVCANLMINYLKFVFNNMCIFN